MCNALFSCLSPLSSPIPFPKLPCSSPPHKSLPHLHAIGSGREVSCDPLNFIRVACFAMGGGYLHQGGLPVASTLRTMTPSPTAPQGGLETHETLPMHGGVLTGPVFAMSRASFLFLRGIFFLYKSTVVDSSTSSARQ